ncbi:hypothetical protein HYX70_04695 [Candidatus Saccharibacteria bacterium]|nr:hypothetical protein [Candidatus Saccharibacteria bacterium]
MATKKSNKTAIIVVIAIIVALLVVGGGAYYFIWGNKTQVTTNNGTASVESNTNKKQLNVEQILANVKAKYPTVTEVKIYSEQNDPNNQLGKPGYYIAGGAFADSRAGGISDSNWGAEAGGSIEIYQTEADAAKRTEYLKQFQGNALLDPGAYKQIGVVIVRASSKLTASQQAEIVDYLASQVQ